MTMQFVPSRAFVPVRKMACLFGNTKGAQFLQVINRISRGQKDLSVSWALWELVSLTFLINTSWIKDKELRSIARLSYQCILLLPTSELRKEMNLIAYPHDRGLNIEKFDFYGYLSKQVKDIITILKPPRDYSAYQAQSQARQNLITGENIENILLVLEWLRRNPAN